MKTQQFYIINNDYEETTAATTQDNVVFYFIPYTILKIFNVDSLKHAFRCYHKFGNLAYE